jgi:hypothetical protein
MLTVLIIPFLLGCDTGPIQPADGSNEQAATPSPAGVAKALYLVRASGQVSAADLGQHPEVVVVHTFADVQQQLRSTETSLWIDKNALSLIPSDWLMQAPQKFCPLVIVGYNNALYAFRESLPGFGIGSPISGPSVDWSAERIEPGFSVWILQPRIDAPETNYSAVMQGYEQQPTITAIFAITDGYISNNPFKAPPARSSQGTRNEQVLSERKHTKPAG